MKSVHAQTLCLAILALFCATGFAQEAQVEPGSERPMFTRLPGILHSPRNRIEAASTPLQTWNGSFVYQGTTYTYNMVGASPSSGTRDCASQP